MGLLNTKTHRHADRQRRQYDRIYREKLNLSPCVSIPSLCLLLSRDILSIRKHAVEEQQGEVVLGRGQVHAWFTLQLCSSLDSSVSFLQGTSGCSQQDCGSAKVAGTQYPYQSATQPMSCSSRSVPWDMELSGFKKKFRDYYSDIIHIT